MLDFVLLLSAATLLAIFAIMGYIGLYAYRHIRDDSRRAAAQAEQGTQQRL
ncbi:hypothetical protein [Gilvimarinus algae]|uniref:DUF3149 domain-containing protein n=1 Tax=Gilvimarinus algae TaxID=3058037 RepID=A0ABT8TC79_9GAMM|nr:hypothetical protein [Gilvimarinus sp. SDUM040014]MDO3381709.1 hypothetical protein [Gilvimarinus sp. SDUM040014]